MAAAHRDGSVRTQPYGDRPGAALDKVRYKNTCCKYIHTYTHITKDTHTQNHTYTHPHIAEPQTPTHYKRKHTHTRKLQNPHIHKPTMLPAFGRQHRGCIIPQAVTHSLVLQKMGKIISRNTLS